MIFKKLDNKNLILDIDFLQVKVVSAEGVVIALCDALLAPIKRSCQNCVELGLMRLKTFFEY